MDILCSNDLVRETTYLSTCIQESYDHRGLPIYPTCSWRLHSVPGVVLLPMPFYPLDKWDYYWNDGYDNYSRKIGNQRELNYDTYNWEKIQQWTFGWCELQTITFPRIPKYSSHKIRVHREYLEDKLIHHGKRNITVHRPLHQERDLLVFHADYSCYYYCCCSCSLWFDSFFSSVSVWFEKYKEKREC